MQWKLFSFRSRAISSGPKDQTELVSSGGLPMGDPSHNQARRLSAERLESTTFVVGEMLEATQKGCEIYL